MPGIVLYNFKKNTDYFDGVHLNCHDFEINFSDIKVFLSETECKEDYEEEKNTKSFLIPIPFKKVILLADVWLPDDDPYDSEKTDIIKLTDCIKTPNKEYFNHTTNTEYFLWKTNIKYTYEYLCCGGRSYECSGYFKQIYNLSALYLSDKNISPEKIDFDLEEPWLNFIIESDEWKLLN